MPGDRILPEYQSVLGQEMQEAIFQALGAASVCWDSMEGTGVFMSERATQIGEELMDIAMQYARQYPESLLWKTGRPEEHGYYLAAWKDHRHKNFVVSEMWFNPDSIGTGWWPGRTYLHERVGESWTPPVVAWRPIPSYKPPEEVETDAERSKRLPETGDADH